MHHTKCAPQYSPRLNWKTCISSARVNPPIMKTLSKWADFTTNILTAGVTEPPVYYIFNKVFFFTLYIFFKLLERRPSFTYYEFLYPAHFNGNNTKYWVKSQWLFFCNLFFHPTSCNRSASVSSVFISSLPHSQTEDPRAQLIALKWLTSREKMSALQRTWTGSTFYVCYVSLLLFLTVLSLTLILL